MFGIEEYSTETLAELLSGVTLLISWAIVQVAFGFYYAQEYGKAALSSNSGFVFPNKALPDFSDFLRFALVIGMRIQVPRVQVTSKKNAPSGNRTVHSVSYIQYFHVYGCDIIRCPLVSIGASGRRGAHICPAVLSRARVDGAVSTFALLPLLGGGIP